MPREKDLKRVVRRRMAESGERYTEARAAIRPHDVRRSEAPAQPAEFAAAGLVEVEIPPHGGIRLHLATGQHFVVLKQRGGDRSLPIWIGISEANAIAVTLSGWTVPRPLTSDLMVSTIRALGGEVDRVVIPRVEGGTFYAEVHVRREGSSLPPMDARPSDALGVAVRTGAPIFVADDVMDASPAAQQSLSDAVDALDVRIRTASGTDVRGTAYAPLVSPTHMVVDVANERVVALLRFAPESSERPSAGTLLNLGTASVERRYRVEAVEPGSDGLVRLLVALAEPAPDGGPELPRSA